MAKTEGSPEQAVSEIEAALRSMESLASKPAPGGRTARPKSQASPQGRIDASRSASTIRKSIPGAIFRWIIVAVATAVLPLLVLVRLSVWFYSDHGLWPWMAVVGGALAAAVVFILFALVMIKVVTGSLRAPRYFKRVVFGLSLAYSGYAALYVSATNVKTEQVRETYTSLHPSLRLALSTWMLADSELVITDAERQPEDFARMGLPRNEGSLHVLTSSGYVHAVDLRTVNRPEWRNFFTTIYFKVMGFRTQRHVGTADHLHVSLALRG